PAYLPSARRPRHRRLCSARGGAEPRHATPSPASDRLLSKDEAQRFAGSGYLQSEALTGAAPGSSVGPCSGLRHPLPLPLPARPHLLDRPLGATARRRSLSRFPPRVAG